MKYVLLISTILPEKRAYELGKVAHAFNPRLKGEVKTQRHPEFKASLVYKESSWIARNTLFQNKLTKKRAYVNLIRKYKLL